MNKIYLRFGKHSKSMERFQQIIRCQDPVVVNDWNSYH